MSDEKIKKKVNSILQLPDELILDIPKLTVIGNNQITIENYKGVIEYENYKIRVKVNKGIVELQGKNMIIDEINPDDVIIRGDVKCLLLDYGIM